MKAWLFENAKPNQLGGVPAHDVETCLASFDPTDARTIALVEGWLMAARKLRRRA